MNIVKTSFRYHRIVILLVTVLMMGGAYALKFINKNEFPDCTVRQGIVVAVCPGATAEQVEQEVTKPLEDYIFTYKDVRRPDQHRHRIDIGLALRQRYAGSKCL